MEQFSCLLVIILEYFLDDLLQPWKVLHDKMLEPFPSFMSFVLVRLGNLSEEVDGGDDIVIEIVVDHLMQSVPRVIDKYDDVEDLFEYLNGSFWVDLIEDVEEMTPEELFGLVVEGIVLRVVSSEEVVLQRGGDDRQHILVCAGDQVEKLIDEVGIVAHPLQLHLRLVDSAVIQAATQDCP